MTIPVEIEQLLAAWAKATEESDVDGLMLLCAEDFTVIAGGSPVFSGRDMMRRVYAHVFAETKVSHVSTVHDVRVDGALAMVASDEAVTLAPRIGGEAKQLALRQMTMLVREADGWKFARVLSNMLRPEEAA